MTSKTKSRIYNAISCLCIGLCFILIGRVASEELFGDKQRELHTPPPSFSERSEKEREKGFEITEEMLSQKISEYIPEEFPIKDLRAEISGEGVITFSAEARRKELSAYLESFEEGSSLVLRLLPAKITVEASFSCDTDSESGLISAYPVSLSAADVSIEPSRLPQEFFRELTEALNKIALSSGYTFTRVSFDEGLMILN